MRKTHFARKVFHLALFIKGEFLELGNCLLRTLRKINIKRISWIYFILQGFVFLLCDKHKMVVKTTNVTHTIRAFKFLIQFPQLFFLFKRPYCCTFACISARNNILMPNSIVWETRPTVRNATTTFPREMTSEKQAQIISVLMKHHYPDQSSASDWLCHMWNLLQPIRNTTQILFTKRHVMSMELLHSFLRRHFAEKPVVA